MFAFAATPAAAAPGEPGLAPPHSAGSSEPAAQQPSVTGVFQNYNWQIYGGYSFFRFYVVPNPSVVENMNGLDLGIVYYFRGSWIGVDGDFVGEYGSLFGFSSRLALGMGGGRFRWSAPRGLELWAHGMAGGAHFTPQTVYGSQSAFAYEVGGGVDVGAHHRRLAYRLEADMVGTRFFTTYQYSPRVSVGVVYKF